MTTSSPIISVPPELQPTRIKEESSPQYPSMDGGTTTLIVVLAFFSTAQINSITSLLKAVIKQLQKKEV